MMVLIVKLVRFAADPFILFLAMAYRRMLSEPLTRAVKMPKNSKVSKNLGRCTYVHYTELITIQILSFWIIKHLELLTISFNICRLLKHGPERVKN